MAGEGRRLLAGVVAVSEVELIRDDPSIALIVWDASRCVEVHDLANGRRDVLDREHGRRAVRRRGHHRKEAERDRPHRGRQTRPLSKGYLRPSPAHEGHDVIPRAKWFPERRFSEETGINVDTSVTSPFAEIRFRHTKERRRRETLTEGTAESFGLARERSLDEPLHGILPSMAASGVRVRFEKT